MVEPAAIEELNLPLNVHHKGGHPFVSELKRRRAGQKARACQLLVAQWPGTSGLGLRRVRHGSRDHVGF